MIDPNTAITAAGEGAKAVSKFEEIVQKVFGPRWTKKQADADAYADEKKLQLIRNNPDMEIIYANGQMNARLRTSEALAFRAEQRQLTESIKQEANIESVLEKAHKELLSADEVSDTSVNDDWITRFFGIVKDISSDDMQFIWSKILAGEIIKPGSFSLRTLETIRNISSDEAKTFELVLPFVISSSGNLFIPTDLISSEYSSFKIMYGHIIQLDECGLVNSTGTVVSPIEVPPNSINRRIMNSKNEVLTVTNNDIEIKTNITVYPLTRTAIELMNILEFSSNRDFFVRISEKLHNNATLSNTTMIMYPLEYDEKGNASYNTNKPLYTFCPKTTQYSGFKTP